MSGKTEGQRVKLTVSRVAAFQCPAGKSQGFLWDAGERTLAVRCSSGGRKAFVFQSRLLSGESVRLTIGDTETWQPETARAEARRLQGLIDQARDPRAVRQQAAAADQADRQQQQAEKQRQQTTGLDAWGTYCKARAPHWGALSVKAHVKAVQQGGAPHARRPSWKLADGPLLALLSGPLCALDAAAVEAWLNREVIDRPTTAAHAYRMLRAFIAWCAERPEYSHIVNADACTLKRVRELVPHPKAKGDCLQREQLGMWFAAVRALRDPVVSAYLQCLLLTGARREELANLRWPDVDFQWGSLTIRDKVEGERTIPLTPYMASLLTALPRRNGWVFSGTHRANGRMSEPLPHLKRAVAAAGLPNLTQHGLRRSFGTLCEWVEMPAGVVAQIQGHKPSATAEKHYRRRPLDLLRNWHTRAEAWILGEAGIEQPQVAGAAVVPLRVVGGSA